MIFFNYESKVFPDTPVKKSKRANQTEVSPNKETHLNTAILLFY